MRTEPPSLVSVVIPTHDAADTIGAQLTALAHQDYPGDVEVVVVDNRSSDDLDAVVSAHEGLFPPGRLRLVRAADRAGVCYARNVGLAHAEGDLLAVCDSDDLAAPGWLSALVAAALEHDLVGGRQELDHFNPPAAVAARTYTGAAHLPVALDYRPYVSGCNLAVWVAVARSLGGWDEDLLSGGDDMDFAWRAQDAGFTLGFAPDAVMHYRLRQTLRGTYRQAVGYTQNTELLIERHPLAAPGRPSAPYLAAKVVQSILEALEALVRPRKRFRWAYRAGLLAGYLRSRRTGSASRRSRGGSARRESTRVAVVTTTIAPGGGPPGYVHTLERGLAEVTVPGHLRIRVHGHRRRERNRATGGSAVVGRLNALLARARRIPARLLRDVDLRRADVVVVQGHRELGIRVADSTTLLYMPHSPVPFADEQREVQGLDEATTEALRRHELGWLERADLVVFPCPEAVPPYAGMLERAGVPVDRLRFVESAALDARPGRGAAPGAEGGTNVRTVLFAGRYVGHKGYDLFLDAAEQLVRGGTTDVLFQTMGDGPLKRPSHAVEDLGWRSDPHTVVADADVVVVPNRVAYFDLLPLEVASLGVGLVMTEVGGNTAQLRRLPDAVGCGVDALADGIREALDRLDDDPAWGRGNRDAYLTHYTPAAMAQRWVALLDDVAASR